MTYQPWQQSIESNDSLSLWLCLVCNLISHNTFQLGIDILWLFFKWTFVALLISEILFGGHRCLIKYTFNTLFCWHFFLLLSNQMVYRFSANISSRVESCGKKKNNEEKMKWFVPINCRCPPWTCLSWRNKSESLVSSWTEKEMKQNNKWHEQWFC